MLMELLFRSMFANSRLNELRRRKGINFTLCADLQSQHEAVLSQCLLVQDRQIEEIRQQQQVRVTKQTPPITP